MSMGKWMASRYGFSSEPDFRRLPLDLKRCPLCGTINAADNGECVMCGWFGSFERDPESIEEGLYEMMVRCPDLAEALLESPRSTRRRWSFWGWVRGLFRSRLDVRI
ncbi:MAG TPA: hypothetical protein PLX06_02540 [Fimbriimonadaceae bacterium]|nr:hypothetical protein [Fimbriimonadaceae bacterium]